MLLAHLSDIHLGPLPPLRRRQLIGKRVTGYVNWRRNRAASMGGDVTGALVADLLTQKPDHVAVTGDLTNLALPLEMAAAREWLGALGEPADVSVVPGNHDAYVPGALALATRSWGAWMTGERVDGAPYPFLRRVGEVAVIGCSTAEASAPFLAVGPFRADQARRLETLLERSAGMFRVVMIHHPPVRGATAASHAMRGIGRFEGVIARAGAELVLHGHTHLPTLHAVPGPQGPVPVLGVSAAGQGTGGRRPPARYNLLRIGGRAGAWTCERTERGLATAGPAARMVELGSDAIAVP